ncbi:MAG: nucleotidyltransferase domain-containing protein [Adlercreutzia sp.]|nr:nucleotidyltransferase domain-containing protein [Adlercreutzia sp.]
MAKIEKRYPLSLSDEYLDRVIDSIVGAVDTEQIYVFGSYARGEETPASDLDLYVVTDDDRGRFKCMDDIAWALMWMDMPKDVLANTVEEFNARRKTLSAVESMVDREGVLLYG